MRERTWLALVLLGTLFLAFYRLGAGSLWDQDETKYAQVAVEILQTGDPLTLHINGQPWYVHPPLYMWLVAATGRLVGVTEFTMRVWSALASVLAVYATVLIGRLFSGPRAGLLAGAILAVTFQFLVQSHLAVFDTVLLAWMLLATYGFIRGYREGRRADYLRFFLFAGLATLTKGPIGLLLPGLVIAVFVSVRKAWSRVKDVPWIAGGALYAAVGLSWYVLETWLHGREFVATVFGYYGINRFFGIVENQAGPWYYYVPVVLAGAFPWTAFWPAAAVFHLRRLREDGSLFSLLWCGLVFVFYSAAGTKLPNYILPLYPMAAVAVAAWWDAVLQDSSRMGRGLGMSAGLLLLLLFGLYGGIAGYLGGAFPSPYRAFSHVLLVPAGALAVGVLLAVLFALRGLSLAAFVLLCVTMGVTWLGILTWVMPVVEAHKPMKPLALAIRRDLRPGDRIVGYRMSILSSLIFYTDHRVDWVESPAEARRAVCAPGRVFLVATRTDLEALRSVLPAGMELVAEREGTAVTLKPAEARCATALRLLPHLVPGIRHRSAARAPGPAGLASAGPAVTASAVARVAPRGARSARKTPS